MTAGPCKRTSLPPTIRKRYSGTPEASSTGIMEDPKRFVVWVYTWITSLPIPDAEMERVIQEFSYEGIVRAVPRYFNSSSFRQEWLERRRRLLGAWKCPVL